MLRTTFLILTILGTVMSVVHSRSFAGQGSWQQSVRSRLYMVDALEPANVETTDELINLAFDHEETSLIAEIADMWGNHVVSKSLWREKLVRSPRLFPLLQERLALLMPVAGYTCGSQWESHLCKEALASVQTKSPHLLSLFRQLAQAKSSRQYLQSVPPGAHRKSEFVRQAVRSTLETFFDFKPSADQIRKLALWMHDFDMLFFIQDRAIRRVSTAAEFLRVTDYYYLPASESYRARVRTFLKARVREFKAMNPTADELVVFQRRTAGAGADQSVVIAAFDEAKDAAEFLRAAQAAVDSSKKLSLAQTQQTLMHNAGRFSELEPNADQVNAYRKLMQNSRADIELLRDVLPKVASPADYLKLVRFFGDIRVRRTDSYSEGLRQLMLENLDEFMALSPTTDEINMFREKLMDPTGDLIILRMALERVRSSRELLLLATHFGNEPTASTTAFDFVTTQALVENLDRFMALRPSLAELGYYRARMANPSGDLKLVEYALGVASTKRQMIEIVSRRPGVNTKEFNQKWSAILKKYFGKFESLKPSLAEYGSYIQAVTDDQISSELRRRINR